MQLVEPIIFNILLQIIYFIGIVFLFGYVISLINKVFYRLCGNGRIVCYATGFIGTPIHELSHAVMCLVFGHKITEIKLFQIDKTSGTLGYVNHSYKKRNLYNIIGNYFIGTAPIVVGTLAIYLMIKFMLPGAFNDVNHHIQAFAEAQSDGINFTLLSAGISSLWGIVGAIFAQISTGWLWWAFIVIALCIAIHMNLSSLDIKGALGALPILIIFLIVINFVMGLLFKGAYTHFVNFMNVVGSYLSSALLLSLLLSLTCLLIAFVIRMIISIPSKIF